MAITEKQINLFTSLFKGRQDVFAKRWEMKDKSGYMPAYDIDWSQYAMHKAAGGNLKSYPHKKHSVLSNIDIKRHLEGAEVVGIYPLLENNTSWFVVVDFDENNWRDEIIKLFEVCTQYQLPAYIERSRSGNGGHLWIFFQQSYPALKSRAIIRYLLKQAGIKNASNSSFDRIFPNQDYHTGKGLGNLIALPLQKKALEDENSAFINTQTFEPYTDQWHLLDSIQKAKIDVLDSLYFNCNTGNPIVLPSNSSLIQNESKDLQIILDNTITISRNNLPSEMVLFLRSDLKANNSNFFIKQATGQNTFGTPASTTLLEEYTDHLTLPKGYIGTLLRYCKTKSFRYSLTDKRRRLPEVDFPLKGQLYEYQQSALLIAEKKEMGVIVAAPGSGKTIIGLALIAQKKQPALIIVHRRQLFDQWLQRIQFFLGIPKFRIGKIAKGQIDIGEHVTIAMIQSLDTGEVISKIEKSFGTIIIDECHHVAADSYKGILRRLYTYYIYGLTATPVRKNKDEKLVFAQIGEIIHEVSIPKSSRIKGMSISIVDTDLKVPFDAGTDDFETLSSILIHDTARNSLIADDIRKEINNGRSIIVLTERKDHIEILNQFLKHECETIVLSGNDAELSRKAKIRQVEEGRFQVLITTGQLMGEGLDIDKLDCLFIVYPCSFEGKLIQYIGRIERSENAPTLYDYRDLHIPYLEKMFQKRNKYYNKLLKGGKIGTHEEYLLKFEEDRFYIGNHTNPYPISILEIGINIECFKNDIVWRIKVLKYNEEQNSIFAEVLSYGLSIQEEPQQLSIPLLPIEQIRFRTLDTAGLLKSVVLKKTTVGLSKANLDFSLDMEEESEENPEEELQLAVPLPVVEQWWLFEKIIKIPFKKVKFANGIVSFTFYLSAIKNDIIIEIANPDIRAEFEVVKDYFSKIFKTKSLTVSLRIKHNKRQAISYEAISEEVNAINSEIIDSVKFEFVRKDLFKYRGNSDKPLQTFEELKQDNKQLDALLENEIALLTEILKMESARHYLQLKYLSGKHEASVLKLRFILQPFSFIFLIAGENKYHLIWETLNSEEATYLWHIDKSREALRIAVKEIEVSLNEMKQTGRSSYIKKAPEYFSRIIHDYSDVKKGFVDWKGLLEERLV